MPVTIEREDEKMLKHWFARTAGVRSVHGVLLRAAPFAEGVRDHKKDHAKRVREHHAEQRAAGIVRMPSDPWDVLPLTAQPGPNKHTSGGYEPNVNRLIEAGTCSARIERMDVDDVDTLRIYYGDIGARYEDGDRPTDDDEKNARARRKPLPPATGGIGIANMNVEADLRRQLPRVWSLIHVTAAGAELLKAAAALGGDAVVDMTNAERVRVLLLMRDRPKYQPLERHFAAAELAATSRYASAAAAWNELKGGE